MADIITPKVSSLVPVSELESDSRIFNLKLRIKSTPVGGDILGIIKPIWTKALESELRLTWLKQMINRKLVVRNLELCTQYQRKFEARKLKR